MNKLYYDNLTQAAKAIGVTTGRLKSLKAAGCPGFRHNRIYALEILKWILTQREKSCPVLDLNAERARLAKEQADKLALRNAVTRGELREWSEVTSYIAGILGPWRERLLGLESIAARCNPENPAIARAVLQQWEDETLHFMKQLNERK